ncbi:hypothetical protein OU798_04425 [Prolixibacteraceae bacterium Z1-6]|uniref:Uncharacterized protein n=1 Tax=Draconibacterium aestuarii TaxID=2998507 RepID=A0A9X3F4D9_9BACT|nr:hypothetical protein [Prolixibacteraceae bacterium Z1-6]
MPIEKTWAWLREKIMGIALGIIVASTFYFLIYPCGDTKNLDEVVSKTVDISFIIFGFVLAFLGLVMQTQDKLKALVGDDRIFTRLMRYCVRIITISVVLGVGGFIYWVLEKLSLTICQSLNRIVFSVTIGGLVWLFNDMVYFVRIFYLIIKSSSNKTQSK